MISKNIQRALNYNEQKCEGKLAACIGAGNYLKDTHQMNFYEKLQGFTRLIERNQRATTNSLHISLNFDDSEQFKGSELLQIANTYMQKIGFGAQPYLIYEHRDAGHPHLHIVTTNIQVDGSRISTHNIGRNQSEKARKEIEQEFDLVRATSKTHTEISSIKAIDPQKVLYGQSPTKRSIINILDAIIPNYKYASLPELNAVLGQYNVFADRGNKEGQMYRNEGLVFRILDQDGNKIGVPIKSSSIYSKPTLKNLQQRFVENEKAKLVYKESVKERIDKSLASVTDLASFMRRLRSQGIATVVRRSDKGQIYGVTYVDHQTKSVFNGSDLGKAYSAAGLQARLQEPRKDNEPNGISTPATPNQARDQQKEMQRSEQQEHTKSSSTESNLLHQLTQNERGPQNVPYEFRKKKRKKRKRKL